MSNPTYSKLHQLSKHATLLSGIGCLLHWDKETMMPPGAAAARAEQQTIIAKLSHKERVGKKFRNTLDALIDIESGTIKAQDLTPEQEAALRQWRRDYRIDAAVPNAFVARFTHTTSMAIEAWQHARQERSFSLFAPHLQKVVDLCRKKADYLGYDAHPYDALIDLYEPGMRSSNIAQLFGDIRTPLTTLTQQVCSSNQGDDSFLFGKFDSDKQLTFSHTLLAAIGYDFNHGRVDLSTHPFSSSYHPTDSRITTRIHPTGLMSNIWTLLHECGHSLYDTGRPQEAYGSPLGAPISHGIHESQSRWWETRIGKTFPFWQHFFPTLQATFRPQLDNVDLATFCRALNKVRRSFIRVEADELTYPLHVILRFEMERALIEGSLKVKAIPEMWNALSHELLGITPNHDSEGCLQDIHWACGHFGYFPTYSLGNMYAAQLFETFASDHPEWEELVAQGQFTFIRNWLNHAVWHCGRQYDGPTLIQRVTGDPFHATPYLNYLKGKYSSVSAFNAH